MKAGLALGVILFFLVLIVLGPILTIWALNTLFPALAIPFTFKTWIAVLIVGGLFKTKVSVKRE